MRPHRTLNSILEAGSFRDWMVSHTMYATYAKNPMRSETQMMVAFFRCSFTTVLGSLADPRTPVVNGGGQA